VFNDFSTLTTVFEQVSANPFENRALTLATPGTEQVVPTVFFSNNAGGFTAWAAANAGGGPFDGDYDNDGMDNGLEYFFGETGSSFTANPSPVGGIITWPRDATATGVGFRIWKSETLAEGSWVNVTGDATVGASTITYQLPPLLPKVFIRFEAYQN
jgi:hypothetical protein